MAKVSLFFVLAVLRDSCFAFSDEFLLYNNCITLFSHKHLFLKLNYSCWDGVMEDFEFPSDTVSESLHPFDKEMAELFSQFTG